MKLAKCRNCGRKIDASVPFCPHCEVRRPARRPLGRFLGMVLIVAAALATAYVLARWPLPERADGGGSAADSVAFSSARSEDASRSAPASGPPSADTAARAPAQTSPPAPARNHVPPRRYVHETVNVRAGPGTDNPVLMQVHRGDAVQVISRSDDWAQVRVGRDKQGYIYVPLLKPAPP